MIVCITFKDATEHDAGSYREGALPLMREVRQAAQLISGVLIRNTPDHVVHEEFEVGDDGTQLVRYLSDRFGTVSSCWTDKGIVSGDPLHPESAKVIEIDMRQALA